MENTSGDREESRRSKRKFSEAGSDSPGGRDAHLSPLLEDDEEDHGALIGARNRTKHPKGLNPLKDSIRKAKQERDAQANVVLAEQEQVEEEEQVNEEQYQAVEDHVQRIQYPSRIPSFGDDSEIIDDWTTSVDFDEIISQYEDTCASVVLTRLLQASYNKDRPIPEHRDLSYKDLAYQMKGNTVKDEFGFKNINIPIKYIRDIGLHKDDKISGPRVKGVKTKGEFGIEQNATVPFIYEKIEKTPLGIIIQSHPKFEEVTMDIYPARGRDDRRIGKGEHALLVVAKGRTKEGLNFLIVQNSWGPYFGNNGYARISLADNNKYKIFWPLSY